MRKSKRKKLRGRENYNTKKSRWIILKQEEQSKIFTWTYSDSFVSMTDTWDSNTL